MRALGLAGIAAMLMIGSALGHHSFAMFDQSRMVHLEGTVSDFEWSNPHVWLHVSVPSEDGSEHVWSFEAGSTGQLMQSFWTPETVVAGDSIEVGFHPLKDGSNGGQLREITKADGTYLCQGAACREELREQGLIPPE